MTAGSRRRGGAAPAFPGSLFTGGKRGVWYDPSDLPTMFTDTAGTVAANVGDAIARINDKSGNGLHWTQATAGKRPILTQSGSLYYLAFDNSDDYLLVSTPAFTANMDLYLAERRVVTPTMALWQTPGSGSGPFLGVAKAADGAAASSGAGTPTYAVNGTAVPGGTATTRAQLETACPAGSDIVLEVLGANLSAWNAFGCGVWTAPWWTGTRIYGTFAVEALGASDRAALLTWLGAKAGLTL
ncbi:MAG: hypothetical protein JF593_08435 [Novosphingobium sp.]|nr:hypothetical protein [Novosphingobium sp.]